MPARCQLCGGADAFLWQLKSPGVRSPHWICDDCRDWLPRLERVTPRAGPDLATDPDPQPAD